MYHKLIEGIYKVASPVHTNWYLDVYYNQTKSNNSIYISTGLKLKVEIVILRLVVFKF
mgnify:CR=1 FL=1